MDFNLQLKQDMKLIEDHLEKCLPESEQEYSQVVSAMRYSLLNGGKRLRAVLVLEVCKAFGANAQAALNFAGAIEMVHAYSLIHDDLPCMDNDDTRRGKPSNHIAFGETTALLAGDALLTHAFYCVATAKMAGAQIAQATKVLSKQAGFDGMIGGQVLDLHFEKMTANATQLTQVHQLKTGALICAAIDLGAIAAGAGEQSRQKLHEFGLKMGLAFQITDDILDAEGDSALLGKPTGSDLQNGKSTFVSLYGIDQSKQMAKEYTESAIYDLKQSGAQDDQFLVALCESMLTRNH